MSKTTIEVDTKTFFRFWMVIALICVGGLLLWQARTGLIIIGVAVFLAVALRPLARKISKNSNSTLASILAVALIVFVIGMILAVVGPVVITETSEFLAEAPEMIKNGLQNFSWVNDAMTRVGISDFTEQVVDMAKGISYEFLSGFSGILVGSVGVVASVATGVILVIILTIMFLSQGPQLLEKFWKRAVDYNKKTGVVAERITMRIADVVSKYVVGQVLVGILDGLVVGCLVFCLSLVFGFSPGLAFPMGLISFVLYLIPMFGPIIACILISLLMLFQNPGAGATFLACYVLYLQIENNVIAPKVQGNSLNLPSLLILVAVTIGIYMFGLIGAIISIPIAGIIKVLVDEYPEIKAAAKG
ncbi:AI-2E family transporter [Candidatus Saccharibacteria bacterium]|nr:AI-2E family transporter [Candidatus Saccharibacteria bacterium]